MAKTRAIQILEQARIPFRLGEFEASEFSAEEVSEKLGVPIEAVFKTLVATLDSKEVVMALVPGNRNLSLKLLASAFGASRAAMLDLKDLQRITGYLKGGCSPLGAKKAFPVVVDQAAQSLTEISVSAGLRGLQILIHPSDLAKAASAKFTKLCEG